ncbi:MAG: BatD family protein [Candidatus Binatia bacterium]
MSVRLATTMHAAFGAVLTALLAYAPPASAQQGEDQQPRAVLQVAQGPHYSGFPIDLQVVADGFDDEPPPEVSVEPPEGATLQFVQARPQVSSMMQIVNGRITKSRQVRFGFVYQLKASQPGKYVVGPFTVMQAGQAATTGRVTVNVVDVPGASGQRLRVVLPEGRIFIGQRVPVTVEWWTEAGLADRLYNQRLAVPLFLDTANFQFLDEEKEPSRIVLSVDLPGGAAEFPADVEQRSEGGKNWVVRSFTRTLVPVVAGRFDLGKPTLVCEEATSFQRDIFGSRVPSRTRRVRVAADEMVLDVQAVPSAGRPASFAGAIGQGFTMDVAADRTVLQAGDPVRLTFTIRGDGSLDAAALPPLAAAGLSPRQFRLPEGDTAGITDNGGKRFEVTVRVTDPAVREIPPVEYSWFDPSTGRFETTRSQPIALSVRAATVVGAGDVVSAAPVEEQAEAPETPPGSKHAADPSRAPAFTLTGADLSIETDLARLRAGSASLLGRPAVAWSGYLGGILALTIGLGVKRRRSVDPVKARLQRELRALRSRVASDRTSRQLADALRKMASLRSDTRTRPPGLDAVLGALDETAYAPGGAAAAIPDALRREALAAADAMVEEAR